MTAWSEPGDPWRSGRWSIDRRGDELADVSVDGRVVLRSVRAVVRDRDWNTAAWTLGVPEADGDTLRVPVRTTDRGADIAGTVSATVDGDVLTVAFDAVSHTAFDTNRTGLVVLHPPGLAGHPLRVTHADGSAEASVFPEEISAHQPVFDIAGLAWVDAGLEVGVTFVGDVFEMEDQRNWTDASYKTYSRPLALPFPYALAAGERVRQEVRVRVSGAPVAAGADADALTLHPGGVFPEIVLGASNDPDPAPDVPTLGRTLLVELDPTTPNWPAALDRAASRGLPLDVRIVVPEPDRALLDPVAAHLRGLPVARVAVFHPFFHVSDAAWVAGLRAALADAGIDAPVIGGSRSHYTELNREGHRLPGDLAGITVATTPLFHALSTAQLVEAVPMQRLVAAASVRFADGLPVHLGPVALRPRFNDVATGPQPAPVRDDLAEGYGAAFTGAADPRQGSPELGAWVIASAAALAVPGVASLTYFEEWGDRGIRDRRGAAHPAARPLDELAALDGAELLSGDSPDGRVWAVGARSAGTTTVLVANLDDVARRVSVALPGGGIVAVELAPGEWTRRADVGG